jgi:DNA-binding PadR family transcriptional regulator
MSVKYGLLGLLARQAQHGYELKRTFEQLTGGFWELNQGQIYQSLVALEAEGLVRHTIEHDEAAPDRKVYDVTAAGRLALDTWLDNPTPRARPLRDELYIRLAVMSDGPAGQLLDLVAAHRSVYLERMAELTRAKNVIVDDSEGAGAHRRDELAMESLLLDAAIYHCEADLRWLDHCEMELGRRGGGSDN